MKKSRRTNNLLLDDLTILLEDLENQSIKNNWGLLPTDALHGFITAICIGPRMIPPSVWLPLIFPTTRELPEFESEQKATRFFHALMNIYNGINDTIRNKTFGPYVLVEEMDDTEREHVSIWCSGFALGMCCFKEDEWDIVNDRDLADLCIPIVYYSNSKTLEKNYPKEDLARLKEYTGFPTGLIIDAVYSIQDYFRGSSDAPWLQPSEPQPPKIGRNDPCSCGSGKKFKKCCGKS